MVVHVLLSEVELLDVRASEVDVNLAGVRLAQSVATLGGLREQSIRRKRWEQVLRRNEPALTVGEHLVLTLASDHVPGH